MRLVSEATSKMKAFLFKNLIVRPRFSVIPLKKGSCFQQIKKPAAIFVISASDDEQLNAHIFKLCRKKNILVNTVDDLDKCGFIFPAVVHKNDITVGISTSGKSPIFASYLRMKTENMIDEKCLETIEILGKFREKIKQEISSEAVRKKAFEKILKMCIESENSPDDIQIFNMIEEIKNLHFVK